MDDGLEVAQCPRIVEGDRRQGRSVELASIVEDSIAESLPHRLERSSARTGHEARQGVGVDDVTAVHGQACRDRGLAAADGPREADDRAHRGARSSSTSHASSACARAASTSASSLETRRSSM